MVPEALGRGLRLRAAQLPRPRAAHGAPGAAGAAAPGGAAGAGRAAASQRWERWERRGISILYMI